MNVKIFVLAHFGFPYQEKSEDIVTWLMQEEGVPRGLELENVAMDADYSKAIQLAIEPHKVNSAGDSDCFSCNFVAVLSMYNCLSELRLST